jgi:hypothetical protein
VVCRDWAGVGADRRSSGAMMRLQSSCVCMSHATPIIDILRSTFQIRSSMKFPHFWSSVMLPSQHICPRIFLLPAISAFEAVLIQASHNVR